jgi:hypothetical protein
MGKTHRNVYSGSNSVDYHSSHNRGFAKDKKANTHRKVRTHNNSSFNEDNLISLRDLSSNNIMNNHWASSYHSEKGNIPNKPEFQFNDNYLYKNYNYKWTKDEQSPLDTVNKIIDTPEKDNMTPRIPQDPYLKMCKKQIERRGNTGLFYGHSN